MCFPNVALQCVSRLVLFPFSLPCYVIILTLVASCKMSSTMKVRSWETLRNLPMQLQKQLMAVFMGINWGLVYPLWVCGLFSHKAHMLKNVRWFPKVPCLHMFLFPDWDDDGGCKTPNFSVKTSHSVWNHTWHCLMLSENLGKSPFIIMIMLINVNNHDEWSMLNDPSLLVNQCSSSWSPWFHGYG